MDHAKTNKSIAKINLRNSIRITVIVISIVVFAISSYLFNRSFYLDNSPRMSKDIYTYQNEFTSNYSINIKNNPYVPEKSLPSGQTYVSDLVDSINMNINYKYIASADSTVKYDYKIDVILNSVYTDNGKQYSVWNKTYNILTKNNLSSNRDIDINEDFKVDYKSYHQEVKNFKQSFGMSLDSYLYIRLTVNTHTDVNNHPVDNEYTSDFSITIGNKIGVVNSKDNDRKIGSVQGENAITSQRKVNVPQLIFSIAVMIFCIYVIYCIRFKTKKYYAIKNEYKLELNRILRSCEDKIVIVKNNNINKDENVIDVDNIDELIKLSEELYKPILCWISDDINNQEACFSVISSKVRYRFILKK